MFTNKPAHPAVIQNLSSRFQNDAILLYLRVMSTAQLVQPQMLMYTAKDIPVYTCGHMPFIYDIYALIHVYTLSLCLSAHVVSLSLIMCLYHIL